jgi:hypothetical protein
MMRTMEPSQLVNGTPHSSDCQNECHLEIFETQIILRGWFCNQGPPGSSMEPPSSSMAALYE